MSEENVEILRALLPSPDADIAEILRSDQVFDALRESVEPLSHPDFECRLIGVLGAEESYAGIDGLRAAWLIWVEPWASYRTEIDELIDLDDRVLALMRDHGRREGMTAEVELFGATIWIFEGGKVREARFYGSRDMALEAVGLRQ